MQEYLDFEAQAFMPGRMSLVYFNMLTTFRKFVGCGVQKSVHITSVRMCQSYNF